MTKEILVNIGINETRVAILENGVLVEFSLEQASEQRRAGNIYRGRVENVLPGMQAAFIDIGEEKNAFLYIDDVIAKEGENGDVLPADKPLIQDLLHEGQEIIVQMVKEPMGTKGARVITQITLPGRYLVLIPTVDYIGISRRIENETERERLKSIVSRFKAPDVGLIVRTVAEEVDAAELQNDYEFLIGVWKKIQKKTKKGPCPSILYRDHDLLYRIFRDYLGKDVDRLVIDDFDSYNKSVELVKTLAPSFKNHIQYYNGPTPIFEAYQIELQLEKAIGKKVWLDNGAYLVIDQTEALTVIDVNTGKFTGSTCLKDTVFATNLAAAQEIARQIRLRNLGGIIIIDFIDMVSDEERRQVIEVLEREMGRDKTKISILGFTSLGLLEMTRKKVKQSLREIFQSPCEFCDSTGYIVSSESIAQRAIRMIRQIAGQHSGEALLLGVNPQIASLLIGPGGANLEKIERYLNKVLYIKGQENIKPEQVRLLAEGTKEEIDFIALPVREGEELELKIAEAHLANPEDGIGRIEGYVVDVAGAGNAVNRIVKVAVTKTFKTYAKARMID